jgi:hypothetical protein
MRWVGWAALLASLLVAVQIAILLLGKEGLCLSQGCQVVDQLTRVSPLLFNIAGLLYFQVVFWGTHRVKREDTSRSQLVRLLLFAGLAAEGVLVGFQQIIAGAFCTYCLIVLGFIILLNLLAGFKQLLAGAFVFGVVLLAFSSLEFQNNPKNPQTLHEGVFASRATPSSANTVYLFYSSTCAHCQRVLEVMAPNKAISMHFNPIDTITSINVPGVILNRQYDPKVNKTLLKSLDIEEIPVLLERKANGYAIIKGETAIMAYFDSFDSKNQQSTISTVGQLKASPEIDSLLPRPDNDVDGCSVNTDCDTIPSLPATLPAR